MASVNRWAIYCHFYRVAVNPCFPLPDRKTRTRSFSANMEIIPATIMRPIGTRNGLFGDESHEEQ